MNHTTTKPAGALASLNFGNGLVEIGALTTLIGSNIAGDLALGNRGSAGLVWGSITTFGNSSVIKACAGAAIPGWLRQILGLRTRAADAAVGMDLPLSRSKFPQSVRNTSLRSPLAILCRSDELSSQGEKTASSSTKASLPYRDVFAFDRTTSVMLEGLAATPAGSPLSIYTFHPYKCRPIHNTHFQIAALGLSLFKLSEIYYLFIYGGAMMGLLSAIPYMFSFLVATIVESQDIIGSRRPMSVDGYIDLVVGTPPTTKHSGGARKVVLGAMKNPKIRMLWKTYWSINALLQAASLFIYYLLLGQEKIQLVITWAGFQVAWVTLRTFIFYLTDSTEPMMYRRMNKHALTDLTPSMRLRVVNLVAAVGTYQMHHHPRNIRNYNDDTFSATQISQLLAAPNMRDLYEIPDDYSNRFIQLNIIAIIGDTLFSGATWMAGLELSPMDLYDSCIVVLSNPPRPGTQSRSIVAIPAARVFSATQSGVVDSESVQPEFVPRGAGHNPEAIDERQDWIYWIPCLSGAWMQVKREKQTVLGQISAEIMSDKELTTILRAGKLNIGLKDADDVKTVISVSRQAANCLLSFLNDTEIY